LVGIAKSVDEAALRDLDTITSSVDSHADANKMPTPAEVMTAPAQSMRGGAAEKEVAAHSVLLPQEGLTRLYGEFDTRMSAMQKSIASIAGVTSQVAATVNGLVAGLTTAAKAEEDKAEDEKKEKEEAEKAAKSGAAKDAILNTAALKARVAVRKAEDEDEDEDEEEYKEHTEKARAAIKALSDLIVKAEDEAEDEEDEHRTEKARAGLKTLKAALKAAAVARETAKADEDKAEEDKAEDEDKAEEDKAEDEKKDEAEKAAKSGATDLTAEFTAFATAKGMTVADLMSVMGGSGAKVSIVPPSFVKAATAQSLTDIDRRLEDAVDSGVMDNAGVMKAESIKSHLVASRSGHYDTDMVIGEIAAADPAIRDIFLPQITA
jgi:hypothetical protein